MHVERQKYKMYYGEQTKRIIYHKKFLYAYIVGTSTEYDIDGDWIDIYQYHPTDTSSKNCTVFVGGFSLWGSIK